MNKHAILEHVVKEFCKDENITSYIARVFDFDYPMPEPYRSIFERKFYMRYRYYEINYDSFFMFQNYLESKLLELLPKYLKLYESADCIINPFINTAIREDAFNSRQSRTKDYSTAAGNNSGHTTNANGSINVAHNINSNTENNAATARTDTIDKAKSTSDNNQKETHLFSDTPQSKFDPDNKQFNNGYITTINNDHIRDAHITSGVNEGYQNNNSAGSRDAFGSSDSYTDSVNEGEARSYAQTYDESERVSALKDTVKNALEREGLEGITVSSVLNEWRTTFINVDKMLLDDLRELFMLVY